MRAKSAEELEDRWKATPWFTDRIQHLREILDYEELAPALRARQSGSTELNREYCRRGEVDTDAAFIFYWNSLLNSGLWPAPESRSPGSNPEKERESFKRYLEIQIIDCDYQS